MKHLRPLVLIVFGLLAGTALAQAGFELEIPEGSLIRLSSETVLFDLAAQGFPPPEFPHSYLPTAPTEPLIISIYSNITGSWILQAGFSGGLVGSDGQVIPPEQLEYSFNGGPWFAFAPNITLFTSQGASNAFEDHTLQLRLTLIGNEMPGRYQGVLDFTLVQF